MNDTDQTGKELMGENEALHRQAKLTDRKLAETALEEREDRFLRVFDEGPLGLVITDLEERIQQVNRRFCKTLGYSEHEIIALGVQGITHPDDRERQRSLGARLLHGEIPYFTIEKRYLRKDGQVIWGQLTVSLLRNAEGQPTHALGMIEDITDHRRAVQALLESERRLSTLMSNLTGMAYRCRNDATWSMEFVSEGCFELTGYQASELVENRVVAYADIIHPEDRQAVWDQVQRSLATGRRFQFEYRIRTAQGAEKWVWEQGVGVRSGAGEIQTLEGFITDITARKRAAGELQQAHDRLERCVEDRTAELRQANQVLQTEVEQRRQAEQALRDSESRLNFALEVSGTGAWDLNLVDHTAHRSLQHDRIFGYDSLLPTWSYASFLEHVLPEEREAVDQQFRQALATQSDWRLECRIRRNDERVRWIWAVGRHRSNGSGPPRRMTGIVQDITDRKRAEETIQRSEAKYRALVESCPDAVAMIDLQGRIVFASPRAAEQHAALHPDELLGRPAAELVVPEDRDRFRANTHRLIAEGTRRNDEYRALRRDGTTFDAEISSAVIRDAAGLPEALMGVYRDISERKRAEEHLTILRQFAEAATQGFGMTDLDGLITYVNPFLAQLFGVQRPDDMLGRPIQTYYPEDYLERREKEVLPALRRQESWQGEVLMAFPDGQMHTTMTTIFPVQDESGKVFRTAAVIADITALKRTEEALRQSYEELWTVYHGMVDGLLIADLETQGFVRANWAIGQMLGYAPEQLLAMSVRNIHPPEAMPQVLEAFAALAEGRILRADNVPVLCRDGSVFYADITANHIVHHGRSCMIGFFRDVTERRQAQQTLTESEEKYRHLIEMTDTGFLILDGQGRVLDANAEYIRISGHHALREIIGRSVVEWTAPYHAQRNAEEVRQCLRQGNVRQLEVDYLRGDGTVAPTEINARVVNTDQGPHILALCRDISARKRAENAMQQTLAQLETICGGMIEGLLITDIETKRFVRVNASLCRMLGYSEEELLAASIPDIHPPTEVSNDLQRFQAAAEGRVSINEDRPVLRKDGSIFFADITGHQIFYNERPCLLALFRDVTERKQAEERLQREQQALRRMVVANDHERRLITYELHDGVAQQLAGAMMHLESLEPRPGRKSKAAEDDYQVGMAALRQAALEIRKLMNGLRTPVLDSFGLAEAIADVEAQLRSIPGAPEIDYRHDVQFQRLEPLLENSLYRIAQEAMTNACRHSRSEKLRVRLTQQGDEVTLEVRDWGLGFAPGTVAENRFGLEGIRERSRLLGGKLSIESAVGQGTTVRVTFPVIEASDSE